MPRAGRTTTAREDPTPIAKALVSRLYHDILQESCVVFVGAGSTTERRYYDKSFFDDMMEKLEYPKGSPRPSFPELMQHFCDKLDGGHHNRLIREAISRIEVFCSRGDRGREARIFTDALAEIPYFNRFVTTNWDPFLERSLDVLVPIVEDRDLAFWDDRRRQVLKVHGCITKPYSIIATSRDYNDCMTMKPLVFNKLKDLMTTKTFIFVGYSMRDPDFRTVWDVITGALGRFAKLAYALDPGATEQEVSYWSQRGIELCKVTDVLFIRHLRSKMESEDLIPTERHLEFLSKQMSRITSIHVKMGQISTGRLASAMYQDGLLHGLSDVLSSTSLGTKKQEDFERDAREADQAIDRMRQKEDPIEIAYWTGRKQALSTLLSRKQKSIPPYFHPDRTHPTAKLVKGVPF